MSTDSPTTLDVRRYRAVFVAQLILVAAAVVVSRLDLAVSVASAAVLVAAALNAAIVAFVVMGVGRDGRYSWLLVIVFAIVIAGLLVWPAWDVYDRRGPF